MIHAVNLLWICPLCALIGAMLMAIVIGGTRGDD